MSIQQTTYVGVVLYIMRMILNRSQIIIFYIDNSKVYRMGLYYKFYNN